MPKTQPRNGGEESATVNSTSLADRIGENILQAIGRPPNLLRIQVKLLWKGAYRVNVFVGHAHEASVSNSFFLEVTDTGDIVKSAPVLTRVY